jgi:ribose transport system ATP-binding protein/D-xylose transport system ATP-binding protein
MEISKEEAYVNRSPALSIRGLGKAFGATLALDSVTFDVHPGEVHGVLGQNGAGKSTLVKILTAIYPAGQYEGEFAVNGDVARFASPHSARLARVGYVPQEIDVVNDLDVAENVLAGRLAPRLLFRRSQARLRAQAVLNRLGLAFDVRQRVGELSAARRQMVMIARALANDPHVLILDEPTTSLSEKEAQALCRVIRGLADEGLAIVFITHRVREVMEICDNATVLRDGRIAESLRRMDFTEQRIVSAMAGREVLQLYPGRNFGGVDVILRCTGVSSASSSSGGSPVKNVSLSLRKGEILGVAGVLGSGRTELLQAIFGESSRTGEVIVNGTAVKAGSPKSARRAGIGMLTEDRKSLGLLFNMPVAQNISMGNLGLASRFGLINRASERSLAASVASEFSVKIPSMESFVTHLSGGNQQKLLLGRTLAAGPQVLLLDEPTKGVDVGTRQQIYQQISNLSMQGIGVIVVSSELDELLGLSDRVVVLSSGAIVDEFLRGEGDEERILHSATVSAGALELNEANRQ